MTDAHVTESLFAPEPEVLTVPDGVPVAELRASLIDVFNRSREHADMPFLTLPDVPAPSVAHVSATTNARAARVIERCRFHITGFVLSDKWELRKAIVEEGAVRWLPNREDFTRVMKWQDTKGPNTPPDEAIGDELIGAIGAVTQATSVPPAGPHELPAPKRPLLTAMPSARLLESTEEALGALASELGCVHNEDIPHNAGWFVPGKAKAYASAFDAIKGLVDSLKAGGTVYVSAKTPKRAEPAKPAPKPEVESAQVGLF